MKTESRDWKRFLRRFFGKKCAFRSGVFFCGEPSALRPYLFDADKEAAAVEEMVYMMGGWEEVEGALNVRREQLVMFAVNSPPGEKPFHMADAVFFYDRRTGRTYSYEEASFQGTRGDGKRPYRLDELQIEPV